MEPLETAIRELQAERAELLSELTELREKSVGLESLRAAYNELLGKYLEAKEKEKTKREPK